MKITCEVICDLLPLYHDGVCSESSKLLVEEHLKMCKACNKELSMISERMDISHINPEREKSFKAVSNVWKKNKTKSFRKGVSAVLAMIVVIITVVLCCFSFPIMKGRSMSGYIEDGDICLVSKLAYTVSEPVAGEVICTKAEIEGRVFDDIVRIVAVPGDSILIESGILYINGEANNYYEKGTVRAFDMKGAVTLSENEYFVMGDDQSNSIDSRSLSYGLLSRDKIKGKVIYVFSPLSNPFVKKETVYAVD